MKKLILLNMLLVLLLLSCSKGSQKTFVFISSLEDNKYSQLLESGAKKAAEDYNILLEFKKLDKNSSIEKQKSVLIGELEKEKPPTAIAIDYYNFDGWYLEDIATINTNNIPIFVFNEKPIGNNELIKNNIKQSFYVDSSSIASLSLDKIFLEYQNRATNFSKNNKAEIAIVEYASSTNRMFVGNYFETEFAKKITNEIKKENESKKDQGEKNDGQEQEINTQDVLDISEIYEINKIVLSDNDDITILDKELYSLINNKVFAIFFTDKKIVDRFLELYKNLEIEKAAADNKRMLIIGIDSSDLQMEAIKNNFMYGSILRNPYLVGYFAVEGMLANMNFGESPNQNINPKWYDSQNIDSKEISLILY